MQGTLTQYPLKIKQKITPPLAPSSRLIKQIRYCSEIIFRLECHSLGTIRTLQNGYTSMTDRCTRGYGLLEKFLAKWRARIANKHIPSSARKGCILDIGCGSTPFFLTHANFAEKFGIDPAVDTDLAQKNLTLSRHDIEKNAQLPFDANAFDVVTMLAVFEHIEPDQLATLLQEIHRILKPNGRYILTTPSPWGNVLLWFMARMRLVSPTEIDEHKDGYHQKTIVRFLTQAGFERNKIARGYFELFMNNWVVASKA